MAERKQTPDVLGEILGEVAVVESRAAAAPAARRSTRQHQPAPDAPQVAWEYVVVSFANYRGWRPRYMNGQEVTDWTAGPLIHEYLNQMGAEGWEVVGAGAGQPLYGSADHHQVYLKRRRTAI